MASIAQRANGKWRARYRDPTGREHARHFDDRRDAEAWLAEVAPLRRRGGRGGLPRFGDQAVWWQSVQVHRQSTAAQVDSYLRNHVLPALGDRPLVDVRPSEIQAWVKDRSTVLAPASVELVYRYVAAIFASAVVDGLIATSPCRGIKLPRCERRPVQPLTVDQVLALADAVPARWRALVLAASATGLRQGELFGLTMPAVDFLRRTVRVHQQLVLVRGAPRIGPPKTAASYRTVPLPCVVVDAFAAHLARWPPDAKLELVFTTDTAQPIRRTRFHETWARSVATAGLPDGTRFHELRHFYASLLISAGESVKVVQARLGHASATETLDIYGHLWPDADDRTRDAIDAAFATARGAVRESAESCGLADR